MGKTFLDLSIARGAMTAPILGKEEEYDLAVAWRDRRSPEAYTRIFFSHIRLVVSTARQFRNYQASMADLEQEGMIGLVEALKRFDPDRGVRFSTYAQWWIRSFMSEFVQRNYSLVRLGTNRAQKILFFNLRKMRGLVENHGQNMSEHLPPDVVTAIAETLKVREIDVRSMELRLTGRDSSLNATIGDEGSTSEAVDLLPDEAPGPEEILLTREKEERGKTLLLKALEILDEREALIVKRRRLSETPATLAAVGEELDISKERVRQIEHRALVKLKDWIGAHIDEAEDLI